MGDAVATEAGKPFGFGAEDKALMDRPSDACGRTFEVGHHTSATAEEGVDFRGKEGVHAVAFDGLPDAPVEHDVADEGHPERVRRRRGRAVTQRNGPRHEEREPCGKVSHRADGERT